MGVKKKEEWSCDLCGRKEEVSGGESPSGWVTITIDSLYVDREWFDRILCGSCISKIKTAMEREKG